MNIVLFGDSITDARRERDVGLHFSSFGMGYAFLLQSELATKFPKKYNIYNRGISGNRVVDLYARIKTDCWNLEPDVLSILVGANDVWHELDSNNGVEIDRYERVYRTIIEETKERFPNVKIMLLEPFVLKGIATVDRFEQFCYIKEYAKIVKKLAKEYNLPFVALQEKLDDMAKNYGDEYVLGDGIHPTVVGAKIIANEWLKAFEKI